MVDLRLDLESTRHVINKSGKNGEVRTIQLHKRQTGHQGHVEYTLSVDIGCTVVRRAHEKIVKATAPFIPLQQ